MSEARHDYRYKPGRTPVCERCGCKRRSVGSGRKWQYSTDGRTWTNERPPCKTPDFVGGWSKAIANLPRFGPQKPPTPDNRADMLAALKEALEYATYPLPPEYATNEDQAERDAKINALWTRWFGAPPGDAP
jgi:hypothetical protein